MSSSVHSFLVWLIVLFAIQTTTGVNGCTVTPSAAAVVAGDDISLTCTARNTSLIDTWKLGSDSANAIVLYRSRGHSLDGSIRNRTVAVGYLANDTNPRQVILTITKASTDQAESYYCTCVTEESIQSSDFAFVSVLVSEPTFSNATEMIDGELVIFTCNVSFSGLANVSLTIRDAFRNKLNTSNYAVTSKGLHKFSLDYSTIANSSISQEYSCNITLTNDTTSSMVYSKRVESSVQWVPVQSVRIKPIDETRCRSGDQCGINQAVQCTAEGNPKPVTFQWMASVNGSGFTMDETSGSNLTFEAVGRYTVQCIAYNMFHGTRYNSSSSIFTTQVDVKGPNYPKPGESPNTDTKDNTPIIVGVVVGVGGLIIIVLVIGLFLFCKRKKSRTGCFNHEDEGRKTNDAIQLSKNNKDNKSVNTDNSNGMNKNVHTTSGVQNKSFEKNLSDETTVVENDLYSGKSINTQIDPSDGGYAALNEVQQNR